MNDITKPLRLAIGSHEAGSGKGCAMNVISWENGDTVITDHPSCSAVPLAKLVQGVNDKICSQAEYHFLCPECSLTVLDLGHATTGTAGATRQQEAAWAAELMDSPEWGVTRLLPPGCGKNAVEAAAALLKRRANNDEPAADEWAALQPDHPAKLPHVDDVTYAAAYAAYVITHNLPYTAYTYVIAHAAIYAANVTAYAAVDVSIASGGARAARIEHCRSAIAAWHRICGTAPAVPEPVVTELAVRKMSAT